MTVSDNASTTDTPRPLIRVRGTATLEVEPEIASIIVVIRAQDRDRRKAWDRLTERNDAIRRRIKECQDAVEELSTGVVNVGPMLRDRRSERVRSYQSQVRLRATFNDFEVLGVLIAELGDQEMTEISGPRWGLRPDSEVYARARTRAVREAVSRARVYAEAVGSRVEGLLEIADTEFSSHPLHADSLLPGNVRTRATMEAELPREIDLEPAVIKVRAEVEARFVASIPTGLDQTDSH